MRGFLGLGMVFLLSACIPSTVIRLDSESGGTGGSESGGKSGQLEGAGSGRASDGSAPESSDSSGSSGSSGTAGTVGAAGGPGLGGGSAVPTGGGSAAGTAGGGGRAGTPAVGGGGTTATCATGTQQCSGSTNCVNLESDAANCGKCGTSCKTQCFAGACCDAPSKICGTSPRCVNVLTSSFHCGDCDNRCGAGQACIKGVCTSSHPLSIIGDENACDQMGRMDVKGGYIVQSNVWGKGSSTLCVKADRTSQAFTVIGKTDTSDPNTPMAYPSIYIGTHQGSFATEDNPLPIQVSALKSVASTWSFSAEGSTKWDAAYNIWLFPDPKATNPGGGMEIMIWVDSGGDARPISSDGSAVGTATIGSTTYEVWSGTTGSPSWKVISYKGPGGSSFNGDLLDFIKDAETRGANPSWYLVGVEAGFEIWNGGEGMKTTSFSVKPL